MTKYTPHGSGDLGDHNDGMPQTYEDDEIVDGEIMED